MPNQAPSRMDYSFQHAFLGIFRELVTILNPENTDLRNMTTALKEMRRDRYRGETTKKTLQTLSSEVQRWLPDVFYWVRLCCQKNFELTFKNWWNSLIFLSFFLNSKLLRSLKDLKEARVLGLCHHVTATGHSRAVFLFEQDQPILLSPVPTLPSVHTNTASSARADQDSFQHKSPGVGIGSFKLARF